MPLLCVLLGVLLPLAVMGSLLQASLRPLSSAGAYRQVAWKLGLEADTRGVNLRGHLDGRRLFVGEVVDEDGRHIQAVLDLAFPLGVGLLVRRARDRVLQLRRRPSLALGDPRLQGRVQVLAFEPDRARRLLDPDVRAALLALVGRWPAVEVTDHWVRVALRRAPTRARELLDLIDALRTLALAVEAARERLPPTEALAGVGAAWASLAAELGVGCEPDLPAIRGDWAGRPVAVHVIRTADGHAADVVLGRLPGAPVGLRLAPAATAGEDPEPVGRDIEVGEPVFDAAFAVQGWDPHAVRAAVPPAAREALLRLLDRAPAVRADDARVAVDGASVEVDALRTTLGLVREAAEALDAVRRPAR